MNEKKQSITPVLTVKCKNLFESRNYFINGLSRILVFCKFRGQRFGYKIYISQMFFICFAERLCAGVFYFAVGVHTFSSAMQFLFVSPFTCYIETKGGNSSKGFRRNKGYVFFKVVLNKGCMCKCHSKPCFPPSYAILFQILVNCRLEAS